MKKLFLWSCLLLPWLSLAAPPPTNYERNPVTTNRFGLAPTMGGPWFLSFTVDGFPLYANPTTAGIQTPWGSDIDAANYQLLNLGLLELSNGTTISAVSGPGTSPATFSNSVSMISLPTNTPSVNKFIRVTSTLGDTKYDSLLAADIPDLSLSYDVLHAARDATNGLLSAAFHAASDFALSATTVTINGTAGRVTSSAGALDLSANRAWTLDLASGIVTPGTYRSMTVDTYGRATGGSNPTTFSGYGLSDTSANLASALSDETGSGAAVFATSPTLVTPNIGQATGNLTGTATLITQPAINTFASASNSITMSTNINNVFFFLASTAVSLTNVTLSIAGQMTYADLIYSNSLATSITNFMTIPGAKIFGVNSTSTATNALIIPAGKEAYWHIECRGINETNVFCCLQQ